MYGNNVFVFDNFSYVFFLCVIGAYYNILLFLDTVANAVDNTQKLAHSAVETGKSYAGSAKGTYSM